jgi:tryprostatin B 6-hydroxylase
MHARSKTILFIANLSRPSGPYGCIAKRMALMDIRQVIARLVWTFDFDLAPGEDGATFETKGVDAFIMTFGEVNLTFKRREA